MARGRAIEDEREEERMRRGKEDEYWSGIERRREEWERKGRVRRRGRRIEDR